MTSWTASTCTANGISIHYLRTGGHKPPLVALHGLTGSGECWTPVVRSLERDYDVVMPDARGHGKSSGPSRGYLYPDLAKDVTGLISALGLVEPVILGHSMGGMTAALVARQLGTTIRAVILVEPTFLSPGEQRRVDAGHVLEQHRQRMESTRDAVLSDLQRRHPHRSAELLEYLTDARLATRTGAFEVLRPPNPDFRELVSHIRVPILLVTAERGVVSVETARELQSLNTRLRHELIAQTGHGLPYDRPDDLAAAVQSFLGS